MQKKNKLLEKILAVAVIIFVIVLIIFIITENKLKKDNENKQNNTEQLQPIEEVKLSQEEALKVGNELYQNAKQAYQKEKFRYVTDENQSNEYNSYLTFMIDGMLYMQISNYKEAIGNDYTANGEKEFKEYLGIKSVQEDESQEVKYYIPAADRGGNIYYINTELKVLTIIPNEIAFNAVSSYHVEEDTEYDPEKTIDSSKIETKTQKFVIKKSENGIWQIDSFVIPN